MPTAQETFSPVLNFLFNLYTSLVARNFAKIGKGCSIRPVLNTSHPENIFLGKDVSFGIFCWVGTNTTLKKNPKLIIGNRVHVGAYSMIIAANDIKIGNNVLLSERVTILDHIHEYKHIKKPVIDQHISSTGKIVIEDDCFLGINSVIMASVHIGKHAVIGANSVVTHNVPPFSVVVGAPAKVIKKYDFKKREWV